MSYRNEIIHVFVCMNRVNGDRLSLGGSLFWCFVGWFGGNRVETRLLKPGFQNQPPARLKADLFINPLSDLIASSS
jgi:hypothetical protein